jgi:hypothetical protein
LLEVESEVEEEDHFIHLPVVMKGS